MKSKQSEKHEQRVILDTNILVSALLTPRGTCARILKELLKTDNTLLTCQEQLQEFQDVMLRPKFQKQLPEERIQKFLTNYIAHARIEQIEEQEYSLPDPDDWWLIALANTHIDAFIVTGDTAIQEADPRMISPKDFLHRINR